MYSKICIVCFLKKTIFSWYIKRPRARPQYDPAFECCWALQPYLARERRVCLAFVSPIYVDVRQGLLVLIISTTSKNNTQRGAEQNCIKNFRISVSTRIINYSEARCIILSVYLGVLVQFHRTPHLYLKKVKVNYIFYQTNSTYICTSYRCRSGYQVLRCDSNMDSVLQWPLISY
jgi:hypothetical protein